MAGRVYSSHYACPACQTMLAVSAERNNVDGQRFPAVEFVAAKDAEIARLSDALRAAEAQIESLRKLLWVGNDGYLSLPMDLTERVFATPLRIIDGLTAVKDGSRDTMAAHIATQAIDALRAAEEDKATTRRIIAHYERCLYDELGCSREDDPLECVRARMQDIRDGDAAIEAAEARVEAAERERDEARAALIEVDGCFEAAYHEGLAERHAELTDRGPGSLHDLLVRRVWFAREAAIRALATTSKEKGGQ